MLSVQDIHDGNKNRTIYTDFKSVTLPKWQNASKRDIAKKRLKRGFFSTYKV
jgi:hypothetical protein